MLFYVLGNEHGVRLHITGGTLADDTAHETLALCTTVPEGEPYTAFASDMDVFCTRGDRVALPMGHGIMGIRDRADGVPLVVTVSAVMGADVDVLVPHGTINRVIRFYGPASEHPDRQWRKTETLTRVKGRA